MSISRVGSASSETTSLTIPAGHQTGDLIFILAFIDGSTTPPTVPAGWTTVTSRTGTTCSLVGAWKIAGSASETSGTWTTATGMMCHVYRGIDQLVPLGSIASAGTTAGTTSPSTYGPSSGVGLDRMDNQWFMAFQFHRSINTTTMNNPPTGYTNVINAQAGATNNMVSFDTNGPVAEGFASNTVAPGGTASGWMVVQFPVYPAMQRLTNLQAARSISAGIISLGERIR